MKALKTSFVVERNKNGIFKYYMLQDCIKTPLCTTDEELDRSEALRKLALCILEEATRSEFFERDRTIKRQILLMKREYEK